MYSSTSTIDDMSDDCIRLVFDRFALNSELKSLRIISIRFQFVAEGLLATRQASICKLKLFPNLGHVHSYVSGLVAHHIQDEPQFRLLEASDQTRKHSAILVGNDDEYCCMEAIFPQFLPRIFINLTELVIVLKLGDNFDLDTFLTPWASQLVSLTLFGNSTGYEPLSVDVISTMTNLRRLNLFNFDLASIDVPKLAPVLSRLEHLGLYNYIQPERTLSEFNDLEPFLNAFSNAQSNNVTPFLLELTPGVCTSLSLSQVTFSHTELAFLIENRPTLLANLTCLNYTPQGETFPLFFPFGLGLTAETLEILRKASLSKLTFLQTSYKESIASILSQLPATFPALLELKWLHFSCPFPLPEVYRQLAEFASTPLRTLCRAYFSIENSPYLNTNNLRSNFSVCPALQKITLVIKGMKICPWAELYLEKNALKIEAMVAGESDLLGHFEGPCGVYRWDAIKAESQRLSNVAPIRDAEEGNSSEAGISQFDQLQASLGVYEHKHRLETVKWNVYRDIQCQSNYCTVLKSEIEQLQGEADAPKRAELQRLFEGAEEKGKRVKAFWKDLVHQSGLP